MLSPINLLLSILFYSIDYLLLINPVKTTPHETCIISVKLLILCNLVSNSIGDPSPSCPKKLLPLT